MGINRVIGAAFLSIAVLVNVTCIFTPGWLYDCGGCFNETCYPSGLARGFLVQLSGNSISKGECHRTIISLSSCFHEWMSIENNSEMRGRNTYQYLGEIRFRLS